MGGHAAGRYAANTAIAAVREFVLQQENQGPSTNIETIRRLVDTARKAVEHACKTVYTKATTESDRAGMGCTLTVLLTRGKSAAMAHVGDSRLYLIRDGQAHQLSTDHTLAAEFARAKIIREDEIDGHPHQNVLTRSIGPQEAVQIDTLGLLLQTSDRLLVCSDGLSRYVKSRSWLAKAFAKHDSENLVEHLIEHANSHGGRDNITAVAVRVALSQTFAAPQTRDSDAELTALYALPFFAGLSLSQVSRIRNRCRHDCFDRGGVVIAAGTPLPGLLVVLEGALVHESKSGQTELDAESHFGEAALLAEIVSDGAISAISPSRVLILERDSFRELVRTQPRLGSTLLQRLGERAALGASRTTDRGY